MEKEIYIMTYKLDYGTENIRVLGEEFVKNNRNKGHLIILNKKYSLDSSIPLKNIRKSESYEKPKINLNLFSQYNNKLNNEFKIKMILNKNIYRKSYMFKDCKSLLQITLNDSKEDEIENNQNDVAKFKEEQKLDLSAYNVINDYISNSPFDNFIQITKYEQTEKISEYTLLYLDKKLSIGNRGFTILNGIFKNCSLLKFLPDISKWNKNNILDIREMFSGCSSLLSLPDISNWNTENLSDMSHLFYKCSSLSSLPDISKWETKNTYDISFLFSECSKLSYIPDISKWETKYINNMSFLFSDCSALSFLPDISKWNTSNVRNMKSIFKNCSSLSIIPDLSK